MKRGEVWTVSGAGGYAAKPRPAVILQDELFATGDSVTVCLFTSDLGDAPFFRFSIEPSASNGLRATSQLMVDKITTVPRAKLGSRVGCLTSDEMLRLSQTIILLLGLLPPSKSIH